MDDPLIVKYRDLLIRYTSIMEKQNDKLKELKQDLEYHAMILNELSSIAFSPYYMTNQGEISLGIEYEAEYSDSMVKKIHKLCDTMEKTRNALSKMKTDMEKHIMLKLQ